MRPILWAILAMAATAGLMASRAYAQFAAEDHADPQADNAGFDETGFDETGAASDPADSYAADPADPSVPPQSLGDRSVADVASGVLGADGTRRLQDAEGIIRTVIGKAGSNGGTPGSSGADPLGVVQDILTAARKTKEPQ